MSRKITCPYCFGEFDDDQVAFRSMTVYQDEDDITADVTGGKYDDYISLQQDDILSAKYNDTIEARKRLFIAGRSDKFNRFWRDFANSEMPEPEWIGQHKDFIQYAFERPVIDKMNGGVKSLHKDNDDFVTGATDFCGNDTFDRVCPHCNNPIPSGYGKYDVKHICLIGLRGSGKTVFLSMFLKKFRAVCEKHGIIISVAAMGLTADFLERNLIKMGGDWPSATSPANLEQPLTFQITTNKKTTTFVFHDIAGENCFNAQGGMEAVGLTPYTKFLQYADAFIYLIDPSQITSLGLPHEDDDNNSLDAAAGAVVAKLEAVGGYNKNVPAAAVISQIDKVKLRLQSECRTLFQELSPVTDNQFKNAENPTFNVTEYNTISKYLKDTLLRDESGMLAFQGHLFPNNAFFGVSAVGAVVDDDGNITAPPNPYRLHEPFFWILEQFALINTNAPVYPRISANQFLKDFRNDLESDGVSIKTSSDFAHSLGRSAVNPFDFIQNDYNLTKEQCSKDFRHLLEVEWFIKNKDMDKYTTKLYEFRHNSKKLIDLAFSKKHSI